MNLSPEDLLRLDIISMIEKDVPRQVAYKKFWKEIYDTYDLSRKRYYNISETGKLVLYPSRTLEEAVRKISKSDQE